MKDAPKEIFVEDGDLEEVRDDEENIMGNIVDPEEAARRARREARPMTKYILAAEAGQQLAAKDMDTEGLKTQIRAWAERWIPFIYRDGDPSRYDNKAEWELEQILKSG